MFASGTTAEAALLRGRRRQSVMMSGVATGADRRRKKYEEWKRANKMFTIEQSTLESTSSTESTTTLNQQQQGSGYLIHYKKHKDSKGNLTSIEVAPVPELALKKSEEPSPPTVPLSQRRQVALTIDEGTPSTTSSASHVNQDQLSPAPNETAPSPAAVSESDGGSSASFTPDQSRRSRGSNKIHESPMEFRRLKEASLAKKREYFTGRLIQKDRIAPNYRPRSSTYSALLPRVKTKSLHSFFNATNEDIRMIDETDEDEDKKKALIKASSHVSFAAQTDLIMVSADGNSQERAVSLPLLAYQNQQSPPSRSRVGSSIRRREPAIKTIADVVAILKTEQQSTSSLTAIPPFLSNFKRLRPVMMWNSPSEREQQSSQHPCPPGQCRFIRINVAGLLFEICASYLDRHPKTLLGDKSLMRTYWEPHRKEYFFDRHRPSFEGIFTYFKYGDIPRKPDGVPDDVFLDELYFFRIEDGIIDQWKSSRGIPIFEPAKYVLQKEDHFFRKLWYMFEFPAHSSASYGLNIVSVIAAVIAVCCLIFESMPTTSTSHCLEGNRPNFADRFFIIETVCTAWFTLELLCRTIGAPSWRDLINYQTAIDVAANAPYYVILASVLITMDCTGAKSSASTGFLRIFRLFSVFKLSDKSGAFALIMNTFKASTRVLTLFFLALAVCVVLFGSFIYIIETESTTQSEFQSIADGFWWAVITMTTVGYGDLIPRTFAGKIVGSCCAIVGVITLSMPIPILTENFNKFYKQMKKRKSMVNS